MYNFIRRVHLFSGLVLLMFIIMYFATGYVLVHGELFPRGKPVKTTNTEMLHYSGDLSNAEFAAHLEDTFDIRGRRSPPKRQKDGSWKFDYFRPGTHYEITVPPGGKEATITETKQGATMIAIGLHRLHGYGGGTLYNAWAVVYDIASASMIVFSLSGIFLWHQSAKQRLAGWICLAASFGFTAAMILYLMFSK